LIPIENAPDTARAIQLAVAPVLLLTGIAALLGVMANRLSRIIDRWRFYQQSWSQLDSQARQSAQVELENLERRRNFASVALYACTLAALLICVVIATFFRRGAFGGPHPRTGQRAVHFCDGRLDQRPVDFPAGGSFGNANHEDFLTYSWS